MHSDYSYVVSDYARTYSTVVAEEAISAGSLGGAIAGAVAGITMVVSIIALVIGVLTIIANWIIFTKAGQKGWKCLIPIYNNVILFRIAGLSPWLILLYFAAAIPVIGWIVVLALTIYLMYSLARAFGKGGAFTVGLVLLNTIFMMILAFGKSEYQLYKPEEI